MAVVCSKKWVIECPGMKPWVPDASDVIEVDTTSFLALKVGHWKLGRVLTGVAATSLMSNEVPQAFDFIDIMREMRNDAIRNDCVEAMNAEDPMSAVEKLPWHMTQAGAARKAAATVTIHLPELRIDDVCVGPLDMKVITEMSAQMRVAMELTAENLTYMRVATRALITNAKQRTDFGVRNVPTRRRRDAWERLSLDSAVVHANNAKKRVYVSYVDREGSTRTKYLKPVSWDADGIQGASDDLQQWVRDNMSESPSDDTPVRSRSFTSIQSDDGDCTASGATGGGPHVHGPGHAQEQCDEPDGDKPAQGMPVQGSSSSASEQLPAQGTPVQGKTAEGAHVQRKPDTSGRPCKGRLCKGNPAQGNPVRADRSILSQLGGRVAA